VEEGLGTSEGRVRKDKGRVREWYFKEKGRNDYIF
jgi:hypothetical protein